MSSNSPEKVNEALLELIKLKIDFERGYEQVMVGQIVDVCQGALSKALRDTIRSGFNQSEWKRFGQTVHDQF